MSSILLDTHTVVWALVDRSRISGPARAAIAAAISGRASIFVSTITIVEICYLIEKYRLPAVVRTKLLAAAEDPRSNLTAASVDLDVAQRLEHVQRDVVPDMPDRIIAATALQLGVPVVSRDSKIRASAVTTIW